MKSIHCWNHLGYKKPSRCDQEGCVRLKPRAHSLPTLQPMRVRSSNWAGNWNIWKPFSPFGLLRDHVYHHLTAVYLPVLYREPTSHLFSCFCPLHSQDSTRTPPPCCFLEGCTPTLVHSCITLCWEALCRQTHTIRHKRSTINLPKDSRPSQPELLMKMDWQSGSSVVR